MDRFFGCHRVRRLYGFGYIYLLLILLQLGLIRVFLHAAQSCCPQLSTLHVHIEKIISFLVLGPLKVVEVNELRGLKFPAWIHLVGLALL